MAKPNSKNTRAANIELDKKPARGKETQHKKKQSSAPQWAKKEKRRSSQEKAIELQGGKEFDPEKTMGKPFSYHSHHK